MAPTTTTTERFITAFESAVSSVNEWDVHLEFQFDTAGSTGHDQRARAGHKCDIVFNYKTSRTAVLVETKAARLAHGLGQVLIYEDLFEEEAGYYDYVVKKVVAWWASSGV